MKKIIFTLIIISLVLLEGCSQESEIIEESNCVFGEVDCEAPGNCGRYFNEDNDNICDYSQ